jgi:hypothetical protein
VINSRAQKRAIQIGFLAESYGAAIKHNVIMAEKTMGVVKAYLKLKAVTFGSMTGNAKLFRAGTRVTQASAQR